MQKNQFTSSQKELNEVLDANIKVHTALSENYDKSPHFNEENKIKVKSILKAFATSLKSGELPLRLLDMGCGTGFIIDLARDLFQEIYGLDATEAMLNKVNTYGGSVLLHQGIAEKTPFKDNFFHLITAYSFMDHLADCKLFLKEVYRLLKPGGIFYADLNPNKKYWEELIRIDNLPSLEKSKLVLREISNVVYNDQLLSKETGLTREIVAKCEPYKSFHKGFCSTEMKDLAREIGFTRYTIEPHWFMGEGKIFHQFGEKDVFCIQNYLKLIHPLSDHLNKYLRFVFYK